MNGTMRVFVLGVLTVLCGCNVAGPRRDAAAYSERWDKVRARIQLQFAEQRYAGGHFEDAAGAANEAITLDPSDAAAYVVLARCHLEMGKQSAVLQVVEVAETAGAMSGALHYAHGVVMELRERYGDALASYERARALDPYDVDYLVAQVECLVAMNRSADASALLEAAMPDFDDDDTLSTLAAHLALFRGDADEAARRYAGVPASGAAGEIGTEQLAALLLEAERYGEALAVLTPLLTASAKEAKRGSLFRAAAVCHLGLSDASAARTVLSDYVRANPTDTVAHLILAKAAVAEGDTMAALRAIDHVRRRAPDHPELWLVRAAVNFQRGRFASAAGDLVDVLANDPRDVEARCLLAEVYRAQRDRDAARTQFERALVIDPACAWAQAGLSALRSDRNPLLAPAATKLTATKLTAIEPERSAIHPAQ